MILALSESGDLVLVRGALAMLFSDTDNNPEHWLVDIFLGFGVPLAMCFFDYRQQSLALAHVVDVDAELPLRAIVVLVAA